MKKKFSEISVSLSDFHNNSFDRGRGIVVEIFWIIAQAALISSAIPGSVHRRIILRLFGATVGKDVVLKPRIRVKFPWRLIIGDNSWIGEGVWVDNLAVVSIASNVCISQNAYICTGGHDWSTRDFKLNVAPVEIGEGAWIAAKACMSAGVKVGAGAVLTFGSVATQDLEPWAIYTGNPAKKIKIRKIK